TEDTLSAENVIHSQCLRSVEEERMTINDSGITILMISRVAAYADRFGRSAVYGRKKYGFAIPGIVRR
ncbi:hypothetical protein RJ921_35040, partial [Pseudomonas aeruginosa]|uniref:hypothetical protein n=1 Tax=Pseudomonas aeruginosa TaxID=287 RepID=UPI003014B1CC